jgi:hypothetical protein
MCEACERGDHANCSLSTHCGCDCAGPEEVYLPDPMSQDMGEEEQERECDDEEGLDPYVLDCGNPDCLMAGGHFLSECFTKEDAEALDEEMNGRPG